jgi:hypothetical protein
MGPALAVYHRAGAKRAVGFWFMHQDGLEVLLQPDLIISLFFDNQE